AAMPRKHGLGGPWVTVRAHYGALPSMAGRVPAKGGETCPDGERCSRRCPEEPVPGSKKTPRRSAGRRCRVLLSPGDPGDKPRRCYCAPFGAPPPLILGRQTKSPTRAAARGRRRLAV